MLAHQGSAYCLKTAGNLLFSGGEDGIKAWKWSELTKTTKVHAPYIFLSLLCALLLELSVCFITTGMVEVEHFPRGSKSLIRWRRDKLHQQYLSEFKGMGKKKNLT